MTRARKVDPAVLEREYVFDPNPKPMSISDLAEKYGMARSGIAEKSIAGHWFEKRKTFREMVGQKVTEAQGDDWAMYLSAQRSKVVEAMVATLDKYMDRLEAGEIKPTVRDAVAVAAALRVYMGDITEAAPADAVPLDPETINLSPAALADFINRSKGQLKALPSGEEEADDADFSDLAGDVEGDAPEPRPTGTEGTRQN